MTMTSDKANLDKANSSVRQGEETVSSSGQKKTQSNWTNPHVKMMADFYGVECDSNVMDDKAPN